MIETLATIYVVADDDDQADAVYAAIHEALKEQGLHETWPKTPVVNIMETRRKIFNG